MKPKHPARIKPWIFGAVTLVALLILAELLSIAALWGLDSEWFSPARAAAKRETVRQQAAARSNGRNLTPSEKKRAGAAFHGEVVHPFLGYVRDPATGAGINRLGFRASPAVAESESGRYTLGFFGGSLAEIFAVRSKAFVDELASSELFAGKAIQIRIFALGGYKQPQQLMALSYALATGEHLDMVVNLDGFNDITLATEGYVNGGLNLSYPRGWPRRAAELPEVEMLRLVGEIAYLEHRRAERAAWCSSAPFSFSPSCYLVWRVFNRLTAARADSLREDLQGRVPETRDFLRYGPQLEVETEAELLAELAGLWARSSKQMDDVCFRAGIEYFHFLQPNQYVPGSKRLGPRERLLAFDPEHRWGRLVPKGYPFLVAEGEQLASGGVRFHDLRRVFAEVREAVYSDRCCHLNQKGYDLLGSAMARIILQDLQSTEKEAVTLSPS